MRAARFRGLPKGFQAPHGSLGPEQRLVIEEVPKPTLGPGEILVKTAACGVCATDLHYLHGIPTFQKPPVTLGHEIAGTIEDAGDGSGPWKGGERVLIPAVVACGHCPSCRVGRDNICERQVMFGNHVDGGFAEFVKAPAHSVIRIPDGLPLVETSLVADAISTPFHAVKNRGKVQAGEHVAVFGCGGVGINAVQTAVACGASVIAVDVDDRKLQLARQLGAVEALNSRTSDVPKQIRALTQGGVDAAFEVVGRPEVLQAAFDSVRPGGRLVTVGYSEQEWSLKVNRVMFRELSIIGSLGCRSAEYPLILRLVERGEIQLDPIISDRIPLERINDALEHLEQGQVLGRQVVVFGP